MQAILVQAAIAVLVGGVSAYVTVLLALRRFRTEQWWVRKADAYTSILEALQQAKDVTTTYLREFNGAQPYTKEHRAALAKKNSTAFGEINKATDIGSFLLCKQAHMILKKLDDDLRRTDDPEDYTGSLESCLSAIDACLQQLPIAARKDLHIR